MLRLQILTLGLMLLGLFDSATTGRADESAVVKAITDLGGIVTMGDQQPGKPVVSVVFLGGRVANADLKVLKELKSLQTLSLGGTKITDACLNDLKALISSLSAPNHHLPLHSGSLRVALALSESR